MGETVVKTVSAGSSAVYEIAQVDAMSFELRRVGDRPGSGFKFQASLLGSLARAFEELAAERWA